MKKYLYLLPLLLLTACDDAPMANELTPVGSTNGNNIVNGKQLYRIKVEGNNGTETHYVYFFKEDGPQPVSINHPSGKTRRVVVYIDDKPVSTNILEDPAK